VGEAAAQTGQAYVNSGLIIEIYRRSDDLICSLLEGKEFSSLLALYEFFIYVNFPDKFFI